MNNTTRSQKETSVISATLTEQNNLLKIMFESKESWIIDHVIEVPSIITPMEHFTPYFLRYEPRIAPNSASELNLFLIKSLVSSQCMKGLAIINYSD